METKDKVKTRMLLFGVMIFLSIIITMQVLADDQRKGEMKPSAKGWQHLSLTHTIGDAPKSGWERALTSWGEKAGSWFRWGTSPNQGQLPRLSSTSRDRFEVSRVSFSTRMILKAATTFCGNQDRGIE